MSDRTEKVAKIRILVSKSGDSWYLLSRKVSKSPKKHGKLEMLGGRLDRGETPLEALERELGEEEESGTLADRVSREPPTYVEGEAGGKTHYLFALEISEAEHARLRPNPSESLGYKLLLKSELDEGQHRDLLTPKMCQILDAFGRK